jgi:hypothetical protein
MSYLNELLDFHRRFLMEYGPPNPTQTLDPEVYDALITFRSAHPDARVVYLGVPIRRAEGPTRPWVVAANRREFRNA